LVRISTPQTLNIEGYIKKKKVILLIDSSSTQNFIHYKCTPQTLNIEGYIKKKKVILLIDSSSTQNFIHYKLAKALNFFIYLAPEFQVMIADGGTIDCSGK
jgi:hypothetical protein